MKKFLFVEVYPNFPDRNICQGKFTNFDRKDQLWSQVKTLGVNQWQSRIYAHADSYVSAYKLEMLGWFGQQVSCKS